MHVLTLCCFVFISMDGFRVVRLDEVVRQIDIIITCTGMYCRAKYSVIDVGLYHSNE